MHHPHSMNEWMNEMNEWKTGDYYSSTTVEVESALDQHSKYPNKVKSDLLKPHRKTGKQYKNMQ